MIDKIKPTVAETGIFPENYCKVCNISRTNCQNLNDFCLAVFCAQSTEAKC